MSKDKTLVAQDGRRRQRPGLIERGFRLAQHANGNLQFGQVAEGDERAPRVAGLQAGDRGLTGQVHGPVATSRRRIEVDRVLVADLAHQPGQRRPRGRFMRRVAQIAPDGGCELSIA